MARPQPIRFSVKGDVQAVLRDVDRVHRDHVRLAAARALNKVAERGHTQAVRALSASTGIKQKIIRERVRFSRNPGSPNRARKSKLVARILGFLRPVPLIRIAPNARARGRGVKAHKAVFPGAFRATMPRTGYEGIFQRSGGPRLPIQEVTIPLEPPGSRIIRQSADAAGRAHWARLFEHELGRLLKDRVR